MPTVLRVAGFRVLIFLPPREHEPPHVHVSNAVGEVVILLPAGGARPRVRSVYGMSDADAVRAFRIVEAHAEYLFEKWREYHG